MLKNSLKPVLLAALLSLPAAPALAQVHIDLPGIDVHVGHRAPPPLRHERILVRPGRDYVWIPGSWDWQGDDWVWIEGRWDRPVSRGVRWVHPRYRREYGAWRYEPGHWSNQRLRDGDDYRRWRDEHRGRDRNRDRDRDRDDHDRN